MLIRKVLQLTAFYRVKLHLTLDVLQTYIYRNELPCVCFNEV